MLSSRQLFLQHVAQTSPMPLMLEVEKAEGVWLYTTDGRRYLDLISGISVNSIGHCHPKVVKAVQTQVEKYMHLMVYGEYVYHPQVELSKRLCEWLGEGFENVYLVNSGTEAIEGAMKLAKRYTGKQEMVAMKQAYHGSTQGALSLQSETTFSDPFRPLLPQVKFAVFNETVTLDVITENTACVVCELVQAESGYLPVEIQFLKALRQKCDECGTLLIFDEIQSGFGRTGSRFAFQQYGVKPDIITLAKGMGGGMPIGAFVSSRSIMGVLMDEPVLGHITTFGGNPVCSAASKAVMDVIDEENWLSEVDGKEALIRSRLGAAGVQQITGKGLMLAAHMNSFEQVRDIIKTCLDKGLVTDWFLFCPSAIRIAPPLSISTEELNHALDILTEAISLNSNKLLSP